MAHIFIEMTGPSGVGKTTLLKETVGLLPKLAAKYVLRHEIKSDPVCSRPQDRVLFDLFQMKFERVLSRGEATPLELMALSENLSRKIRCEMAAHHLKTNNNLLFDEGIAQSFSKELMGLDDHDFRSVLDGRLLVFLLARDPETVADQVIGRKKFGFRHKGKDRNALIKSARGRIRMLSSLAERCSAVGIPSMLVYAEDGTKTNAAKITEAAGTRGEIPSGILSRMARYL